MTRRLSRITRILTVLAAATAPVLLASRGAQAQAPTNVAGSGAATVTDPDGNQFPLQFAIAAAVGSEGVAVGHVNFTFLREFSQVWGVVPVDRIHIAGRVLAGEVWADGTVVLTGVLTEREYSQGVGVVFLEEDVPFRIEIGGSLGAQTLKLTWCLLPDFFVTTTTGRLRVQ